MLLLCSVGIQSVFGIGVSGSWLASPSARVTCNVTNLVDYRGNNLQCTPNCIFLLSTSILSHFMDKDLDF